MTHRPLVRAACVTALAFLAGCGSCGQSASTDPAPEAEADTAPRFMAAGGPDGGRRFRIRGPMVPAVFDAGTP